MVKGKKKFTETLANDMFQLYELIYDGEPWKQHFKTSDPDHVAHRHMVRCLIVKQRPASYEDVARAEQLLIGEDYPDRLPSGIFRSCRMVEKYLKKEKADLWGRLNFYFDVVISSTPNGSQPYLGRIAEFKREKDHVKSILLASLLEYGLVNSSIMQVMLNQYRDVPEDFVNELIETHL